MRALMCEQLSLIPLHVPYLSTPTSWQLGVRKESWHCSRSRCAGTSFPPAWLELSVKLAVYTNTEVLELCLRKVTFRVRPWLKKSSQVEWSFLSLSGWVKVPGEDRLCGHVVVEFLLFWRENADSICSPMTNTVHTLLISWILSFFFPILFSSLESPNFSDVSLHACMP